MSTLNFKKHFLISSNGLSGGGFFLVVRLTLIFLLCTNSLTLRNHMSCTELPSHVFTFISGWIMWILWGDLGAV